MGCSMCFAFCAASSKVHPSTPQPPPSTAQDKDAQQRNTAAAPRLPALVAEGGRGSKPAGRGRPPGGAPLSNLSNLCLQLARRDEDEPAQPGPSRAGSKRSDNGGTGPHGKKRKAGAA